MTRTRWMLFVDGENFTQRGREVAAETSLTLTPGHYYAPDRFLWLPGVSVKKLSFMPLNAPRLEAAPERAYYFAGVQGSPEVLTQTEVALDALGFAACVYQREKGKQSKRVDIGLATTVLAHCCDNVFDVAVIVTGDEDFVPVIEEVKRRGKQVYGWFFRESAAAGLSDELYRAFDRFMNMDRPFRECWQPAPALVWPPAHSRDVST